MTVPYTKTTLRDRAAGLSADIASVVAIIGACASGVVNTVYEYTDANVLIDTHVGGAAVEQAANILQSAKGKVLLVPVAQSTPGSVGSITQSGTGPALSVSSGTPKDDYDLRVKIAVGDVRASMTFRYSLDGGTTWSGEYAGAATFVVPGTGVTLAFATGTYVADELYTIPCTGPSFSTSNAVAAFNALALDGRLAKVVHVVGSASGAADTDRATATLAMASALDVAAQAAAAASSNPYPTHIVLDGPAPVDFSAYSSYETALRASFLAFASANGALGVGAGIVAITSAITGRTMQRSQAWAIVERIAAQDLSDDPKATDDPQTRVSGRLGNQYTAIWYDSGKRSALDGARFSTLRTWDTSSGYFVCRAATMAAVGSDFAEVPAVIVANAARIAVRPALRKFVGRKLRADALGKLDEVQAQSADLLVKRAVSDALYPKHITGLEAREVRDDVIKTTKIIRFRLRLDGWMYPNGAEIEIAYSAPNLATF